MKLSIVIPTLNRTLELKTLLQSIEKYVLKIEYEVIIIDQNPSGFLDDVLSDFKTKANFYHYLVPFKGLSKAKNYGAKLASGEYLSFPDDDCEIYESTYTIGFQTIETKMVDIVFGRCIDKDGLDSVIRFSKKSYFLNKKNIAGGFVEATGLISKKVFIENYFFDENMGVGQFHGAEEGFDWLYRILTQSNFNIFFNRDITFYHPQVLLDKKSNQALKRVFNYSCGKSYLCKKHKLYSILVKRLGLVLLSLPIFILIVRNKAKYYFAELLGLLTGFIID
jgi:glycosyltransferase involved in cell wall biosynthesis